MCSVNIIDHGKYKQVGNIYYLSRKTEQVRVNGVEVNISQNINDLVDHIIFAYGTVYPNTKALIVNINDIPDLEQYAFTAELLKENPTIAHEATGPDNTHYDSEMLPTLLRHLTEPSDKDNEAQFITAWKDSVTKYCHSYLDHLIQERLHYHDLCLNWLNERVKEWAA